MSEYKNQRVAESHASVVKAKKEISGAWEALVHVDGLRLEKESLSAIEDMLEAIGQSLWEKHE